MSVDERARHEPHARLEEVLGSGEATTLMSYLPPVGWADVATKRDLDQLVDRIRTELYQQIGDLRSEIHREVGGLRGELHGEIGGVREEVGGLRGDLHREIGGLRAELDARTRNLFFGVLASNAALGGLVFAAVRLG